MTVCDSATEIVPFILEKSPHSKGSGGDFKQNLMCKAFEHYLVSNQAVIIAGALLASKPVWITPCMFSFMPKQCLKALNTMKDSVIPKFSNFDLGLARNAAATHVDGTWNSLPESGSLLSNFNSVACSLLYNLTDWATGICLITYICMNACTWITSAWWQFKTSQWLSTLSQSPRCTTEACNV